MKNIKTTTTFAAIALFLAIGATAMAQNIDDQTFDVPNLDQGTQTLPGQDDFESTVGAYNLNILGGIIEAEKNAGIPTGVGVAAN